MHAAEGGQGHSLGQAALGQARGPRKDDAQLSPAHDAHKAASLGSTTESGPDQKTHDRSIHFASHTSPQDNNHQVKVQSYLSKFGSVASSGKPESNIDSGEKNMLSLQSRAHSTRGAGHLNQANRQRNSGTAG